MDLSVTERSIQSVGAVIHDYHGDGSDLIKKIPLKGKDCLGESAPVTSTSARGIARTARSQEDQTRNAR